MHIRVLRYILLPIMSNDCEDHIIQIDISVFQQKYAEFDIKTCSKKLEEKKINIYNQNKCFTDQYDYSVERKPYQKSKEIHVNANKNTNRLHIISMNFSDDVKIKKQFTGYLNKLTDKNKEHITQKILDISNNCSDIVNDDIYKIVWQFIERSFEDKYIDILKLLFDNKKIKDHFDTYIINKEWYPCTSYISQNILSTNEEMYDTYCCYVKWKNKITNMNKAWCNLCNDKHMDKLLNDLYELFLQYDDVYKHITDFVLEQMFIILQSYRNKDVIHNLKTVNINKFESSSKFLILNITELT